MTVSAVPVSIPNAAAAFFAHDSGSWAWGVARDGRLYLQSDGRADVRLYINGNFRAGTGEAYAAALLNLLNASAIEARRAATPQSDAVHESAASEAGDAPTVSAYNPNERLREAATAFVAKLVECQSDIDRVFAFAHTHGHIYQGPQYGKELKTLRAALSTTVESHEEVEALKHDVTRQMSIANAECNEAERLREMLVEAREQLWHLAKDPDDNYLIKRIDAVLSPKLHRTIPGE